MIDHIEYKIRKIKELCYKFNIHDYWIRKDGSIDVLGNVNMSSYGIKEIPLIFNSVEGYFACSDNDLTSLFGCPKYVRRNFYCNHNQLTSLEYSPLEVGEDFMCNANKLTSLMGVTDKINGSFYCNYNSLTSYEYLPKYIAGRVFIHDNPIINTDHAYETLYSLYTGNYPHYDSMYEIERELSNMDMEREGFYKWYTMKKRQETLNTIINS